MNKILEMLSEEFTRMERTIDEQKQIISGKRSFKPFNPILEVLCEILTDLPKILLEKCSWGEIAELAKSGVASNAFALGDTKKITLKNGSTMTVRIIGFDHDLDGEDVAIPITFETVETLNEDYTMNDEWTNKGGWEKSELRGTLNGGIFDLLPDDLKAVIKPCAKLTSVGEGKPELSRTVDPLFILSEQEIFGRKVFSIGGEGRWYEWYKQENTTYAKRKQNGSASYWWERSPRGSSATTFCSVSSSGDAGNGGASGSCGVSFGFCV